ncbi:MAG: winged helix-turn-helix transcriptional regulator [Bifidobacteriaceae bacterium]|jgi:ATP-dependent DNA helicase RecG|nr:winged helix-turn-helix transcriptional regulator [Bifidobacteriaceae bacterium]
MAFETQAVEWKSSWRDEYLKWICGFANARGGVMEIGKDDDGTVVGVDGARRLLKEIPDKITNLMAIVADVDLRTEDGLDYLVVTVNPYPNPISYHGRYYMRSGATNRELTGSALDEFMLRKQGKTWDGVPVPYVEVSDLDIVAFRDFRRKARSSKRLTAEDLDVDDYGLIDSLRLGEGRYLRRAAVLLFGEDPEKWVTGAYVKIGYFRTGADLVFMDEVHGPLISMADKVLDILYDKYFKGMISYERVQRIEEFPVAAAAIREAVLNAIVHRDYSTGVPIQIKVFPDHLVIYGDGGLPADWTMERFLGHHGSSPRNPNIANAFFRSGQIEAWGRGIEKIETTSREAHKPIPVFEVMPHEINVTFPFPATFTTSPTGRVVDVVESVADAGEAQARAVLSALADKPSITQKELARLVGVTERTISREIRKLRETGVIRRVGSDRQGQWIIAEGGAES